MVPVSVHSGGDGTNHGAQVTACFVDLPVGEPAPSMRLHQIAFAMRQQMEGGTGRAVSADTLAGLGGFAPPTMHALGARLGGMVSRRLYNVVITNVPGPHIPLYAAGARMVAIYPVEPLGRGQAVSIGLTSYDGGVYYGLNADRDAMPDADMLGGGVVDSLHELLEAPRLGKRSGGVVGMPLTRVYLALARGAPRDPRQGGGLGGGSVAAHAVTPALGKPGLVTDEEGLEHLAGWRRRGGSGRAQRGRHRRRVVAAADVDPARAYRRSGDGNPGSLCWRRWNCGESCRSTSTRSRARGRGRPPPVRRLRLDEVRGLVEGA